MASAAASAGAGPLGLTFAASPLGGIGGLALMAAAGFVDQRYLMPALLGNRNDQRPRKLLDLPLSTSAQGSPRVWAIGRRIRVPTHTIFQSDKVRESSAGGTKSGSLSIKRTFSDVAISLNDRLTAAATQYIANGKLVWWSDRNLNTVRTHQMTVSTTGGRLVLTMASNAEPDFADHFAVDDRILLSDFDANAGPDINVGYWKVQAVTAHGATPSKLTLDIYGGQSLAGLAATAGDATTPAVVARVDDAFIDHTLEGRIYLAPDYSTQVVNGNRLRIPLSPTQRERWGQVFAVGDLVTLAGWTKTGGGALPVTDYLFAGFDGNALLLAASGITGTLLEQPFVAGTSTNAGRIRFTGTATYTPGMFATDPALHYYQGDEVQIEDSVIARHEATGTIPGFRGLAYQVFDQFDLSTYFGNSLPNLEAIIEPDAAFNWQDAIEEICARYDIEASELELSGVTPRPFEGMYLLGAIPGATALQPLLIAGQIVTQDRGGTLAFFQIENADVVQIENGAAFSDLATRSGTGTPNSGDKIRHGQAPVEDLPTKVTVKHQDVDNVYADGSQPFGIRSPTAVTHTKEEEVDLSFMSMTRKEAANLAGTITRRAWINSETVRVELPVAYTEVIENDLLTVTDDEGRDILCRVVSRDQGANFVVAITAVREHLSLAVTGSPVQGAGVPPPPITQAATPVVNVLDIPPISDADMRDPGFYVAACSPRDAHWGGATVYVSRDGGTNYVQQATIIEQVGVGVTTTSLASGPDGEDAAGTVTFDTSASFDVQLENDGIFPLTTVTEAGVLGGINWLCVDAGGGNFEILGARDITDNGGGSYTLSHLLRGLRGTFPSNRASKASGAAVTLLTTWNGVFIPLAEADVPAALKIKVVAPGQLLSDVTAIDVSIEGWNSRPMPVRDFDLTGTTDRTFTLRHWSRRNLPVGSVGPFALDEAFEGYRLKIYDSAGTTLKRVKHRDARGTGSSTLTSATFPYTAAEQTADGYTPGASETFWVEIAQLGDIGVDTDSGVEQRASGRTWRQEV